MEKKKMEISLPKELVEKIEKYVEQGRFKSMEEFIEHATNLLLYAEDNKDLFTQALGN
ncbi:ribbon-helix-helix protein, CopG family [Candidatus Woesearchaeota archaeon]|jgi:Arc/MetJ-type ribon-helix-helix transcriptional regulator|nr:ribbon-helix-helix protein, CopG family [Candidatus Woesearchaeota archaeon]MBT7062470.1 ribbon-helix-helix protein, CopG family [Candidatus Woesearchaeota archaeon]MBT7402903.1 ribbon-helix-helix protein, CopG family [Candidatus Woesearchaeota archaeon]